MANPHMSALSLSLNSPIPYFIALNVPRKEKRRRSKSPSPKISPKRFKDKDDGGSSITPNP